MADAGAAEAPRPEPDPENPPDFFDGSFIGINSEEEFDALLEKFGL